MKQYSYYTYCRTPFLVVVNLIFIAGCLLASESEKLPEAWGTIKIGVAGMKMPIGTPPDVSIQLSSVSSGVYHQRVETGSNDMANALRTGKFYFHQVPFDVPMILEITARGVAGQDKFQGSFTFRKPDLNIVQRLRREKALEYAGYTADFVVDIASGRISHSNRYEK